MMKKIFLILLFVLIALSPTLSISLHGEESATGQTVDISKSTTARNLKPKAPSRQSIYCYYDGSSLYFSFTYSEGDCDLTVSSASGIQSYTFSSDAPESVFIGAVSGASITILTEAGNTYVGEIE
ncbi:MAG: hypothetical protein LIP09_04670 [Bacteroidales bacterium]|nr:hypothetical protein [Bacteroidales bacterium]